MNRRMLKGAVSFFIVLSLICVFLRGQSVASEADDHVARIQKAYETMRDMKGDFIQKNVIKDLNKKDTYKGEFFIKNPLKMKWIYKGKASQNITIKDDTVVLYKPGDSQAFKGKFSRSTYGQTPVALLSGFGDIREEFIVSGKGKTLTLKPKKPMGTITSITVMMSDDDFPIRSFTIQDGRSNVIEIELRDVRINSGIKDSLFDLSLPKGVNIFEQNP